MQLQRLGGVTGRLVRSVSTAAAEYPGSSNYVPGKQGYAPGFPPPKNWRPEVRPKPELKTPSDVPPPSPKQTTAPNTASAARDAARIYKQKLRTARYAYYLESLDHEVKRAEARVAKHEQAQRLNLERRAKLLKERQEYEANVRADPLSAENVLNAEGKTLLRTIPDVPEDGSGYKLAPPQVSIAMPREANEARAQERTRNRTLTQQARHEAKVQALMTLFHEAKAFVHYENLDQKVHAFIDSASFPNRSLAEMVDVLYKSNGIVSPPEITWRTQELQNTLQGTTGSNGNLGYDGLVKWLDSHPEDNDGISKIDED
ncbi:hypothetical protein IWW55_001553 [Coemansia sp. RSA 2706]|nr:hypothetical protein IWW55_001553 [Coemansia sp. RSA 2706]KAJ2312402.1 hypothetical protein IWW54_002108 [Coemansia sp. RSA 2705]KAJ2320799.1 hypothetical protein IWW52_001142 [Coemansia sp. RSA 2704]KAJ2734651.1 hypothetical protein H4R23_002373 [Coemansia sp. Cherry 401B]